MNVPNPPASSNFTRINTVLYNYFLNKCSASDTCLVIRTLYNIYRRLVLGHCVCRCNAALSTRPVFGKFLRRRLYTLYKSKLYKVNSETRAKLNRPPRRESAVGELLVAPKRRAPKRSPFLLSLPSLPRHPLLLLHAVRRHSLTSWLNPSWTTPRGEKTNELEVRTCPINTKGDTAFDQGAYSAEPARNTSIGRSSRPLGPPCVSTARGRASPLHYPPPYTDNPQRTCNLRPPPLSLWPRDSFTLSESFPRLASGCDVCALIGFFVFDARSEISVLFFRKKK